jgi:murein DD-endopeptidase MepM/ murein hydrolase activator NlpD
VKRLHAAALLLASGAAAAGMAAAAESPLSTRASATVVSVVVPGQGGASAGVVSAPPAASTPTPGFAYPADGSAVRLGTSSSSAAAQAGTSASAQGVADALGVSLFNGEITAQEVSARATSAAGSANASAVTSGSAVSGLTVLGQAVAVSAGQQFTLADWGVLDVLAQTSESTAVNPRRARAAVVGLRVRLTLAHGGLPAGSEILVGYADATVEAAVAPPPPPKPKVKPKPATKPKPPDDRVRPARPKQPADKGAAEPRELPPLLPVPKGLDVRLTSGGYVFPVYGPSSFSDTFGAARSNTGWHHGEDIFAPLGAPVLAVTDGTLFSVGWNDVGGLRVWLRDRHGNEFYYAHLSAFSQLAVDGNQVEAGDVLGFMGNTGDAEHTPYHLHFEIHPASMLGQGYDGVVPPYQYLVAWQRLSDVAITGVAGWAAPIAPGSSAPKPGAILLQASDISSASGLEPGSLRRAMREAEVGQDNSLVGARRAFAELLRRLSGAQN